MRALVVLPLLILTGGCATSVACRALQDGAPARGLSLLQRQCRADQGDGGAQLALGYAHETGDGVPRDERAAARYYAMAAADVPRRTAIYVPAVTPGGRGQVQFFDNPSGRDGLAEARYRLGLLYLDGRGVPQDVERGRALIARAEAAGYRPGPRRALPVAPPAPPPSSRPAKPVKPRPPRP